PAAAGTARIPAAPRIGVGQVGAEQTRSAIEGDGDVLDMDVVDPVGEPAEELHGIDALPVEVGRIKEEAELLASAEGIEDLLDGAEIEGELAGMRLGGGADPTLLTHIEVGRPGMDESAEGACDDSNARAGIPQDVGPDGRAGEPGHEVQAEFLGGA